MCVTKCTHPSNTHTHTHTVITLIVESPLIVAPQHPFPFGAQTILCHELVGCVCIDTKVIYQSVLEKKTYWSYVSQKA